MNKTRGPLRRPASLIAIIAALAAAITGAVLALSHGPGLIQAPTAPNPLEFFVTPATSATAAPIGVSPVAASPAAACALLLKDVSDPADLSFGSSDVQVEIGLAPGTRILSVGLTVTARPRIPVDMYDACVPTLPRPAASPGAGLAVILSPKTLTVNLPELSQAGTFAVRVIASPGVVIAPVAYVWSITVKASYQGGPLDATSDSFVTIAPRS